MIEFPLLDIWSKFYRKVIVSYYTQSRARSKEIGETEHSVTKFLFTARRLKARPSARAASQLTHLAWENVTTDVTCGGPVCSDRHGLYVDVCIISITQTSMRPAQATHCVGG